jgi:deoxycytidylate deaminase
MIISKCCKSNIYVQDHVGQAYYVCRQCHAECDTIFSLNWRGTSDDDARRKNEIKEFAYLT